MNKSMNSAVATQEKTSASRVESVADILERELEPLVKSWLTRVDAEPDLMTIPLNFEERTGHLPHLLSDAIARLRLDAGTKAPIPHPILLCIATKGLRAICGLCIANKGPSGKVGIALHPGTAQCSLAAGRDVRRNLRQVSFSI